MVSCFIVWSPSSSCINNKLFKMGQYYKVFNKTKKEYLNPHTFGNGLKLMEFTSDGKGILQGLSLLLANGNGRGGGDLHSDNPLIGSWSGHSITIEGDYADDTLWDELEPTIYGDNDNHVPNPRYDKEWTDISADVLRLLFEDSYIRSEASSYIKEHGDQYLYGDNREVMLEIFADEMKEYQKTKEDTERFRKVLMKSKEDKKGEFSS